MSTLVSPKTKLHIHGPGKFVTVEQHLSVAVTTSGLPEILVRKIFGSIKNEVEFDFDAIESAKVRAKAEELAERFTKELASHVKNKAKFDKQEAEAKEKAKAEKEAAKEAAKEEKENMGKSLTLAIAAKPLQKVSEALVESAQEAALSFLGEKLQLKGDDLIVRKGETLNENEFADAFANLVNVSRTSDAVSSMTSKREAQLAIIAERQIGEKWKNFFSTAPKDVRRITLNVRTLKYVEAIGEKAKYLLKVLPISNLGAALNVRVTTAIEAGSKEKADKENLEARKEIVNRIHEVVEKAEEEGKKVSQIEIQNIVSAFKKEVGIGGVKTRFKFVYLIIDGDTVKPFGTAKWDERAARAANISFDTNGKCFTFDAEGDLCEYEVPGINADIQEIIDSTVPEEEKVEKKKKGKKGKKKEEKKPEPQPDEDEEEEEEELPEPESEGGDDTDDEVDDSDDSDEDDDDDDGI